MIIIISEKTGSERKSPNKKFRDMIDSHDLRTTFMRCCGDTMILPVFARAHESRKLSPLLKDDKAVEIEESICNQLGKIVQTRDSCRHYAFIMRTICFDRLIKDFIWRHPHGTVINIGCGLDSTFERLNPKTVQWYDLDLPDVIELRKFFFTESENRKFISSSFLDNEWLRRIVYDDSLLVFASGVFYYYGENTIKKFFAKLSFSFPSYELLFDITSSAGVRTTNRMIVKTGIHGMGLLKWGVKDYRNILQWNPRMVFLGKYRLFHQDSIRPPLKYMVQGLISDALSIEQVLHLRIRYKYRSL